jgi:hypothetical protein
MGLPPGSGHSLEDGDQFGNGLVSQDRRLGTRLCAAIGAGDRDVAELARGDLDLTMADVTGEVRQPG